MQLVGICVAFMVIPVLTRLYKWYQKREAAQDAELKRLLSEQRRVEEEEERRRAGIAALTVVVVITPWQDMHVQNADMSTRIICMNCINFI